MQCFAKISRNESIELRDFSRVLFGRRCDSKERQRNAHVCVSSSDAASASYAGLKPEKWRLRPESNRCTRICNPLHSHSATQPFFLINIPASRAVSSTPGTIPDAVSLKKPSVEKGPKGYCFPAKVMNLVLSRGIKNPGLAGVFYCIWSGKRDSNSRPQPWQGCALPAELFPQFRNNRLRRCVGERAL